MKNLALSLILITVLFAGIFTVFATVVYAKNTNLLCSDKPKINIILKNDADVDAAKIKIAKIPQTKIIKIIYRDKEWSKMVNKMDLPKMDNPFKNEITVRLNKKANINELSAEIKEMDFVENVEYIPATKCREKQN